MSRQETELKVARYIIRTLLKHIRFILKHSTLNSQDFENHEICSSAEAFIDGYGMGRGAHFEEERAHNAWVRMGHRYALLEPAS